MSHVDDEGLTYQAAAERDAVEHDGLVQEFAGRVAIARRGLDQQLEQELAGADVDAHGQLRSTVGNIVSAMSLQSLVRGGYRG